jgi:hypothetical protein
MESNRYDCLNNTVFRYLRERGGLAPRVLKLCTRLKFMVSFSPLPTYPWGKNIVYSWNRRFVTYIGCVDPSEKRKIILPCL